MTTTHEKLKEARKTDLTRSLAAGASQILLHVKWPIVLETQLVLEGLKKLRQVKAG
ncbi:MAG: hypothetical protein ACKVHO_02670 [Verrucomicrobiia bacterium]